EGSGPSSSSGARRSGPCSSRRSSRRPNTSGSSTSFSAPASPISPQPESSAKAARFPRTESPWFLVLGSWAVLKPWSLGAVLGLLREQRDRTNDQTSSELSGHLIIAKAQGPLSSLRHHVVPRAHFRVRLIHPHQRHRRTNGDDAGLADGHQRQSR